MRRGSVGTGSNLPEPVTSRPSAAAGAQQQSHLASEELESSERVNPTCGDDLVHAHRLIRPMSVADASRAERREDREGAGGPDRTLGAARKYSIGQVLVQDVMGRGAARRR